MPGTGGRFGTKLPPPAAITITGAVSTVPASVASCQRPSASLVSAARHLAEMEVRVKRLDLLQQPVRQLLAGDDRDAGNVVDRLFGIELGALAAGAVEDVDQMAFQIQQSELEHGEQADGTGADNDDIGLDGGRFRVRHGAHIVHFTYSLCVNF